MIKLLYIYIYTIHTVYVRRWKYCAVHIYIYICMYIHIYVYIYLLYYTISLYHIALYYYILYYIGLYYVVLHHVALYYYIILHYIMYTHIHIYIYGICIIQIIYIYIYIHLDPLDRGNFHTKAKIDQFRQNQEKKTPEHLFPLQNASESFLNAFWTFFTTPERPKYPERQRLLRCSFLHTNPQNQSFLGFGV